MGFTSIWHWVIVLVIVLLLFGAGKIPRLMGDLAKGVKAFKSGLKEEEVVSGEEKAKQIKAEDSQAAMAEDKEEQKQAAKQ